MPERTELKKIIIKKPRARVLNRVDLYIDEHQVLQVHGYNH